MDDFSRYYEATEPNRRERAYGWATAIGLQDVDGLKPSRYLIDTAKRHIEGEISQEEARRLVDEYYEIEQLAVKAILGDPRLSAAKLAEILGVKQRQAQRVIASLKKKAGLKRRGARKNGEWYFESIVGTGSGGRS